MTKPYAIASLVALAIACGSGPAEAKAQRRPAIAAAAQQAGARFAALSARFIASLTRLSPVYATVLGEHRYDGQLPDITAAGRAAQNSEWRAILAQMNRINRKALSRDNQVDFALLSNELRYQLWSSEVLQDWAWNPQIYNDTAGGALYGLAARDFAGWDVRLKNATLRMEALPALLAETRRQLVPARVPKVMAETVAKQNGGIIDIADSMLAPHAGSLTGADRARFDAALAKLKLSVTEHQQWLDSVLVPQAKGEFRLGAKLYDEKMRFGLMSDITRPQLKALALKAKAETRAEMYALSRRVLAGKTPGTPLPENPSAEQQQAAIEAALALSYAKRPDRARLEQRARETTAEATAFVRAKGFIRMPDGPVQVITMPKFQQGFAVAYSDSPGALERGLPNFYAVSPIPDEWSDEQATSFLRSEERRVGKECW